MPDPDDGLDFGDGNTSVLLLSGGLDSTALAALTKPGLCLFIDYGQKPATAEHQAAQAVADQLHLRLHALTVDLRPVGGGLMSDQPDLAAAPSPEWWPYRNQFLITLAAATALQHGLTTVLTGTVAGDGARHADGTPAFYETLSATLALQEGGITVKAPAITTTTQDLVRASGLGEDILGWTVSCHRAALPCGQCPGCHKRRTVLDDLNIMTTG